MKKYSAANSENRKNLQAKWREENKEHLAEKGAKRRIDKRAMCMVSAARIRAKKKGIPFNLTATDVAEFQAIINIGKCELTGVKFTVISGKRSATSPSLDRIVPELGYVSGNVRVVCHAINAGMGDWGETELKRIVTAWLDL